MKHFYEDVPGYFWFESAYRHLLDTLPKDRPSVWVELGVYYGRSLAWLGVEVLNRQLPVTIYGVDLWPNDMREITEQNLSPIAGAFGPDLILWQARSTDPAPNFQDGSVDVVWVDADHSYEACKLDIETWWPKVRVGGYMGGDDLEMGGVELAVRTFERSHKVTGDPCEASYIGERMHVEIGYGVCTDGPDGPRPYPYWLVRK